MTSNERDTWAPPERVRWRLVEFTRALRMAGVNVPTNASLNAAQVLAELGTTDRERTKAGLRAAVMSEPNDTATFDRIFELFWRQLEVELGIGSDQEADRDPDHGSTIIDLPNADPSVLEDSNEPDTATGGTRLMTELPSKNNDQRSRNDDDKTVTGYSRRGQSTTISAQSSSGDDDLEAATKRISGVLAELAGRRRVPSDAEYYLDVRRALRESYQTGGIVISTPMQAQKQTATRILFLVDVSKSILDVIDRDFLIQCLVSFQANSRTMRTFFFDTSLQEVTNAFDERTPSDAYNTLECLEAEWGGGTQIGEAITRLRKEHLHAVDRRTAVVVISDGLETGNIDALKEGMSWLSRRAPIVLWWNPLATSPEYEPTCRGMSVAMSYVDGLFSFADVEDVCEIARQLERYNGIQPLGYERNARHELSIG